MAKFSDLEARQIASEVTSAMAEVRNQVNRDIKEMNTRNNIKAKETNRFSIGDRVKFVGNEDRISNTFLVPSRDKRILRRGVTISKIESQRVWVEELEDYIFHERDFVLWS